MITKYSFSFRVLTSKLTKLQIFCHIWIGPRSEFIYWKKLNKLSNNRDKLITTSFFVCPYYLQAFVEWSLPIDWLLCAVLILSIFSCLLWAIKNWIYGVYSFLSFFSFQNLILVVINLKLYVVRSTVRILWVNIIWFNGKFKLHWVINEWQI